MCGLSNSETFMLQLISRETGKPTIAAVADSLLRNAAYRSPRKAEEDVEEFGISIFDIEAILEGNGKQRVAYGRSSQRLSIQGSVDIWRQTS